jgi:hypothetical protein
MIQGIENIKILATMAIVGIFICVFLLLKHSRNRSNGYHLLAMLAAQAAIFGAGMLSNFIF